MVPQGTAMLGATQIQNIKVCVPKLRHRDRVRSVMSSVTHCDSQESQGIGTAAGESCLNWVQKM